MMVEGFLALGLFGKVGIMALVRYKMGGYANVGDRAAENLVNSGFWEYADEFKREERVVHIEPAKSHALATNTPSQGEDTNDKVQAVQDPSQGQEQAKNERPDVATVRAWAKENNIEVSDKGRVSADVYEQYAEAHKN